MIKKILLMTTFCLVATPDKITTKDNTLAVIAGGVGLVGTAVYWASRESNESFIARAKELIKETNILVQEVDACLGKEALLLTSDPAVEKNNINALYDKFSSIYKQLTSVYDTIHGRYESSLTPWNWSEDMLDMCNNLKSVISDTQIKLEKFKSLSNKINYLHNLASYQRLLQSITLFIAYNKDVLEQRASYCDTLYNLEQVFSQKKLMENDLSKFFANYNPLRNELQQIASCLEVSDRAFLIERDFDVLYQQALYLQIILEYSGCITHMNNETICIREARKIVGESSYPIRNFIDNLNKDINRLLKASLVIEKRYAQFCIETLTDVKNTIIASDAYIAERRAYEVYLEQKRQADAAAKAARAVQEAANAARRQAQAAQEAADAAYRQARATEEQNRLKKEENRIQQERNNIERNKQQNNNDRW